MKSSSTTASGSSALIRAVALTLLGALATRMSYGGMARASGSGRPGMAPGMAPSSGPGEYPGGIVRSHLVPGTRGEPTTVFADIGPHLDLSPSGRFRSLGTLRAKGSGRSALHGEIRPGWRPRPVPAVPGPPESVVPIAEMLTDGPHLNQSAALSAPEFHHVSRPAVRIPHSERRQEGTHPPGGSPREKIAPLSQSRNSARRALAGTGPQANQSGARKAGRTRQSGSARSDPLGSGDRVRRSHFREFLSGAISRTEGSHVARGPVRVLTHAGVRCDGAARSARPWSRRTRGSPSGNPCRTPERS